MHIFSTSLQAFYDIKHFSKQTLAALSHVYRGKFFKRGASVTKFY